MKYIKKFENIRVGDYVICVNDKDRYSIKNGEIYKIADIFTDDNKELCYRLENKEKSGYYAHRFRELTDLERKTLKYNL